jgi:TolB protein
LLHKFLFALIGVAFPFVLLFTGIASTHGAEVYLQSIKGKAERISIVISGLVVAPELQSQGRTFREVLESDIRRSYVFNLLDVRRLRESELSTLPDAERVKQFGSKGASAVIWMNLRREGKDMVLEAYAYDGGSGQRALGKRYRTGVEYARTLAHRISDDLVLQFTGERGIAQTRIAFVSDKTRFKEL